MVVGKRLVVVGEILWDVFAENEHLGGAPFNFAVQASRLGHEVTFVSAVGDDVRGRRALTEAREVGLSTETIAVTEEHPTGWVSVYVNERGSPDYTLHRPAAYDAAALDDQALNAIAAQRPSWICFGTLHSMDPRARRLTRKLIDTNPDAQRLYDVNLRKDSYEPELVAAYLETADVVKVNEDEAAWLGDWFGLAKAPAAFCREAAERFGCRTVCLTLGPKGCCLLSSGSLVEAPGYAVEVADTVGAGDAFTAGLLHGIDQGWAMDRIADFANRVGALVAGRNGALPPWSLEELDALG